MDYVLILGKGFRSCPPLGPGHRTSSHGGLHGFLTVRMAEEAYESNRFGEASTGETGQQSP
jgi:hypothetical protein